MAESAPSHPKKLFRRAKTGKSSQELALAQVRSVSRANGWPTLSQWRHCAQVLPLAERRFLHACTAVFVLSFLTLSGWYVATHRQDIPAVGGSYTEALVGEPQLINPLYAAASDVDADLAHLIFSGLMRFDALDGLKPDLASAVFVSEDGKTYTLRIREETKFHNGESVRARDVLFTINAIQNPAYRSPLLPQFRDITATQVDDLTISFALKEPNAAFLSSLTVGILPVDVWADVPAKNATLASLNLQPVGSGPYQFAEFSKDQKGSIKSYTLKRNTRAGEAAPLLETLTFKFYSDAEAALQALQNKNVEGVNFVPANWRQKVQENRGVRLLEPDFMRQVTLYFNADAREELKKKETRQAIALAIDKQKIVDEVLFGAATVTSGPLLPHVEAAEKTESSLSTNVDEARRLINTVAPEKENAPRMTLTLTTVQSPEFVAVAEGIAKQLFAIGIQVDIEAVEPELFFTGVLEPRTYELLLTGTLHGAYPDPYPFWHSSQRDKGSLNLSRYGKRNADTLIEDARSATDADVREKKYRALRDLLDQDVPAVFLYQSKYAYAVSSKINRVELKTLSVPADRFSRVNEWYVKTKKVLR